MTDDLKQRGYLRYPTLAGDRLVFMAEDDLWTVDAAGGVARRLTTSLSRVTAPVLSPDGKWLVFAAAEDGPQELYVMPADGGETSKLTHLGANTVPSGWHPNGDILFTTDAESPFVGWRFPYRIGLSGGQPEALPWGPAQQTAVSVDGGIALARNGRDAAHWKRYRGGTAGHFWVRPSGEQQFTRWSGPNGNLSNPMWVAGRLYFLSDHEGIGNVYSALPDGSDVRRHTDHETYYARNAQTDGRRIVYHAGGDVYVYDPVTDAVTQVPIVLHSPAVQRARRFVTGTQYIEEAHIHPQGHSLLATVRGRLASFGNWEGPVYNHGDEAVGRYRLPRWLPDGERFVAVASTDEGEALQLHDGKGLEQPTTVATGDVGLIVSLQVAPKGTKLALTNHRNQLIVVDWESREQTVVEQNDYGSVSGIAWSPDGRWLAYAAPFTKSTVGIKLWQPGQDAVRITDPVLADMAPAFDPAGKYLYFLSARVFNPVYDALHFDLGFVHGLKPCLITLQADTPSPFMPAPRPVVEGRTEPSKPKEEPASDEDDETDRTDENEAAEAEVETAAQAEDTNEEAEGLRIDLDGITRRVLMFPVPEANYRAIAGIDGKVLLLSHPLQAAVQPNPAAKPTLLSYDLKELKLDTLAQGVTGFSFSFDYKTAVLRYDKRVRVLAAGKKPDDKPQANNAAAANRASGWVNLDRIKVAVHPEKEWRHMLREAWHLQRHRFWTDNMSDVDWDTVWERYSALLPRLATRSDLSDLMWEMQGELGTSHAYESGGDYRRGPNYGQGFLGGRFCWDEDAGGYRIESIVQGDGWADDSALLQPGVQLAVGDVITAIDNQRLSDSVTPDMCLIGKAGQEVGLRVVPADGGDVRNVTVKALDRGADVRARYRDWVETNRRRVHEASDGRLGYVHVPDMVGHGFAEFHRSWLTESERDGLIIDVRHNRGGHVSQLLLEKLSRRAIAFMVTRWGQPQTYPRHAVMGPLVAITNERAGSDGDIFSHSFKLMKLGPLIGKRTWGGVIGIAPRHALVDGTVTTQPEFAYWFPDVGWGVENYGTDPDIDVDDRPEHYATGEDAQLDRAIAEALARLEADPPRWPAFDDRPVLSLPQLPPRDRPEVGDDVS